MKVDIVPCWKQVRPELAQELMAFWRDNKAIGDDAAAAAPLALAIDLGDSGGDATSDMPGDTTDSATTPPAGDAAAS